MIASLDRAFRAAGWTPIESESAMHVISCRERELGWTLPAALRDLYCLENGVGFLSEFSCDSPVAPEDLGKPLERRDRVLYSESILPFMVENQAVACWGITLDEHADPRVVVMVDGRGSDWQPCADRFSDWLECQVRDALHIKRCAFAAQASPLSDSHLATLRDQYREGLRTAGWPGRDNYRFSGSTTELLLWDTEDQCDWWVAPAAGADLAAVLDDLPRFASQAGWFYELVPEAKIFLER